MYAVPQGMGVDAYQQCRLQCFDPGAHLSQAGLVQVALGQQVLAQRGFAQLPGAAGALAAGKSLLPSGVKEVSGAFARGDVVDICDADGALLARGLVEYDAADAARIAGRRKDEIEVLLGDAVRPALVHRDHLVML